MTLNCTLQSNLQRGLLRAFISTAVLIVFVSSHLKAQVPTLTTYAGAGGTNDYYAGDNNDALTAKFSSIKGVAVDAAGNVYVSDFQNYCIRKITTDGKVSVIAGIPKTSFTVTNNVWPSGNATATAIPAPGNRIAVAGNGTIYFIGDSWTYGKIVNGNISYFKPASMVNGTSLGSSSTFKLYGNYMYRAMGNQVSAINLGTEKEEKRYTVTGGDEIRGLGIDATGTVYTLSRNGQFSKINTTTDVVTSVIAANSTNYDLWIVNADLVPDNAGNVLMVKEEGNVVKINTTTSSRTAYVNGPGGSKLAGMVSASNGDLYIADQSLFKVYRVRLLQNNSLLSSLTISAGTLNPTFVKTTSSYAVALDNNIDKFSVTPTVEQADATVQVRINSGTLINVASGTASPDLDLNVGSNAVHVIVTAQNGSARTYVISVSRKGAPPPVPTNLVATPAKNSVQLRWDAAPGANRYKLYRGTSPDNLTLMSGMPITATSYTDNGVTIGTTYYYAVVAMETTGAESAQSTAITGKPNTPPVVTDLVVGGTIRFGETVTASYSFSDAENGNDASTYQWYRSNTSAGTGKALINGATAQSYQLTLADFGKYISVRVTPSDGISSSAFRESAAFLVQEALPVKLVSFTWKQAGSSIQLNWQTATEINSHHFELERSSDGRSWVTIGAINAAGESNSVIRYSYTDNNPAAGRNFYRLKMVDKDEYTEYSDIIRAGSSGTVQPSVSLYPVPAGSFINVESPAKDLFYIITNSEGKEVKRGRLTKALEQVQLSGLTSGVYYFKAAGNKAVKFVKQ